MKDQSYKVFAMAMGDKPKNSKETQKIASMLATGNYPSGLDDCFIMGTMGGCGLNCFVFLEENCKDAYENLEHNKATKEQLQKLYDDGYYIDIIERYCKDKQIDLKGEG